MIFLASIFCVYQTNLQNPPTSAFSLTSPFPYCSYFIYLLSLYNLLLSCPFSFLCHLQKKKIVTTISTNLSRSFSTPNYNIRLLPHIFLVCCLFRTRCVYVMAINNNNNNKNRSSSSRNSNSRKLA